MFGKEIHFNSSSNSTVQCFFSNQKKVQFGEVTPFASKVKSTFFRVKKFFFFKKKLLILSFEAISTLFKLLAHCEIHT